MVNEYGSGGGIAVKMKGPFANVGGGVVFTTVTLPAANWKNGESPYFQEVTVPYVTKNSMVCIHPSPEQLVVMNTIFIAKNDGGKVTVYAIGSKPNRDFTFQASVSESMNAGVIHGLPSGQNLVDFNAEQFYIDVGVKTVNGNAPDEFGNVEVPGGFNGTINGATVDENGNIDLTEPVEEIVLDLFELGTGFSVVQEGQTVTITENREDGPFTIVMHKDEADFVTSITVNGKVRPVSWSGF